MRKLLAVLIGCVASTALAADTEWEDTHKAWTIRGKEMSSNSGNIFAKIDPAMNMSITGQVKIDSFADEGITRAVIMFRYRKIEGGSEYYGLSFWPKYVSLQRVTEVEGDTKFPTLGKQQTPTPLGRWIKFKIIAFRNKIQISFAAPRKLTIQATDPAPIAEGTVCLRASNAAVTFRDVKIKAKK